jgi:hypothetical protein
MCLLALREMAGCCAKEAGATAANGMVKQWIWMLAGVSLLCMAACREPQHVEEPSAMVPVVSPDTTNMKSLAEFDAHVAQRAPADTGVIGHARLQAMLTDSIAGYVREVNEAETFHAPQFTFAEASKVFYNLNGDYIELTAGDYVANPDFFRVNIQRYNLAMGVEISGVKDEKRLDAALRPAGAKDFFAWASYNNRKHLAWVFLGIDERYFVTIEATSEPGYIDVARVMEWVRWDALYAAE